MTDEEKIKRAKGIICKNCKWNECDNNACPTLQETIEAIELGLEEGRKEKCLEQNKDGTIRPCEVMKDNEELKAQIEKMKNVGNCKHSMQCSKWVEQHIYQNNIKCCSNCDEWELAE